jgi:hypothetical protein
MVHTDPTGRRTYRFWHLTGVRLCIPHPALYRCIRGYAEQHDIRVYELTESIIDSVHTYSNHTIAYDKQHPLGELTFTPAHPTALTTTVPCRLRHPDPAEFRFGLRVLLADTSNLTTNDEFVDYFKGIAVVAEPRTTVGEGAMLKMTVSAGYSKLSVYYHNLTDTTSYTFGINTDCERFGHYEHHGYSGASPMLKQHWMAIPHWVNVSFFSRLWAECVLNSASRT